MKRGRLFVAVAAALSSAVLAQPSHAADHEPAKVVVTGTAEIRVAPDRAFVMLAVESRDPNPREAQQQNAKTSDAVLAKLRGAGLGDNAIRTVSYGLQEEFDYNKGTRRSRGYLARNQVEVRLDDIKKVGEIIDLATRAGATAVSGLRFDVKKRDELEREALKQAVSDGRARAEAAAAGAGSNIGSLLLIEQQGAGGRPPPEPVFRRGAVAMSADAAAPPPIQAGEIEISAAVRITAELE
ncbi:MAG: SIMPL domain-containing protein [Candidatus Binatia bacterium]|nr:SIMPL domain-containing protein [Candidatus Binatia bacterium]